MFAKLRSTATPPFGHTTATATETNFTAMSSAAGQQQCDYGPWVKHTSRSTGKCYYFNPGTSESLWHDDDLPLGWAWGRVGNNDQGGRYFVHLSSGNKTSYFPSGTDLQTQPAATPQQASQPQVSLVASLTAGDDLGSTPYIPDPAVRGANVPAAIRSKRDYLFSSVPESLRWAVQVDDVALYSATEARTAAEMSSVLAALFPGGGAPPVITDATAAVGGNTLSFALAFPGGVHAVELSPQRAHMLSHNVSLLGPEVARRVTVHAGDYVRTMFTLRQDIVFFDPPWGGPGYLGASAPLDMFLGETNVADVAVALCSARASGSRPFAAWVAIKAPLNYNIDGLTAALARSSVGASLAHVQQYRKMQLLLVRAAAAPPLLTTLVERKLIPQAIVAAATHAGVVTAGAPVAVSSKRSASDAGLGDTRTAAGADGPPQPPQQRTRLNRDAVEAAAAAAASEAPSSWVSSDVAPALTSVSFYVVDAGEPQRYLPTDTAAKLPRYLAVDLASQAVVVAGSAALPLATFELCSVSADGDARSGEADVVAARALLRFKRSISQTASVPADFSQTAAVAGAIASDMSRAKLQPLSVIVGTGDLVIVRETDLAAGDAAVAASAHAGESALQLVPWPRGRHASVAGATSSAGSVRLAWCSPAQAGDVVHAGGRSDYTPLKYAATSVCVGAPRALEPLVVALDAESSGQVEAPRHPLQLRPCIHANIWPLVLPGNASPSQRSVGAAIAAASVDLLAVGRLLGVPRLLGGLAPTVMQDELSPPATLVGSGVRGAVYAGYLDALSAPRFGFSRAALKVQPWDERVAAEVALTDALLEKLAPHVSGVVAQETNPPLFALPLLTVLDTAGWQSAAHGATTAAAPSCGSCCYQFMRDAGPSLAAALVDNSHREASSARGTVRLPPRVVCAIYERVLRALAAMHSAGYLHADVHAGNVLLPLASSPAELWASGSASVVAAIGAASSSACLADFGSAQRLTIPAQCSPSSPSGTLQGAAVPPASYTGPTRGGRWDIMPPEQFAAPASFGRGGSPAVTLWPSSDIFAAAAMAAALLAAEAPFAPPAQVLPNGGSAPARLTLRGTMEHPRRAADGRELAAWLATAASAAPNAADALEAAAAARLVRALTRALAPAPAKRPPRAEDALADLLA